MNMPLMQVERNMREQNHIIFIFVLFYLNCHMVYSDESADDSYPNYEYVQIFRSMPTLFEYLLNAVEEKPEILEKNDISLMKREYDQKENQVIEKRSADESSENEKKIITEIDDNVNNGDDKPTTNVIVLKDLLCTVANEYGNSIIMVDPNNVNEDNKAKREIGHDIEGLTTDSNAKDKTINSNIISNNKFHSKLFDPGNDDVVWFNDDAYPGFESYFNLDIEPDEIQRKMIMTEQLLEDYNREKARRS